MFIGEPISMGPFDEVDLPAECSPRSLKLLPCLTAFETLRIMDDAPPSPACFRGVDSPRIMRAISSSNEKVPSILCLGRPALLSAGDIRPSDPLPSLLWRVLIDSFCLCVLAGGGGGGTLGAVKFSTGLLPGVGLLDERGGGASKLCRIGCGESTLFDPESSELFASTYTAEVDDSCLPCTLAAFFMNEGVGGSVGDVCFNFGPPGARESPRTGRGGAGALPPPSLRLGSSNGLTPECCELSEAGELDSPMSERASLELPLLSDGLTGETSEGDSAFELLREVAFFDFGASCNRKPSFWLTDTDPASTCCVLVVSCAVATRGDAAPERDAGVLFPDVSRFRDLPFS